MSAPARSARNCALTAGVRFPIVLPRNATIRVPPPGSIARWRSKSPTTACTRIPGYSSPIAAAAARSVSSSTSKGTNRSSVPASDMAESRRRVLALVPEPSSISVSAPAAVAMSAACASRIARSQRVR